MSRLICKLHHVPLVCLACLGATGGKVTTEAKAQAARENGLKGGRPRKETTMSEHMARTKSGSYVWMPKGFDLLADYASPRTYKAEYARDNGGGHTGQYCRVRVDHEATGAMTPGTGDTVVTVI